VPLCQATQQYVPFRTWVSIISFPFNTVTVRGIEEGIEQSIERVREQGFKNVSRSDILVVGHSAGGAFGTGPVGEGGYGGMVQLGSVVSGAALPSFPVPTLTLAGELDGLMQITRVAEEFRFCRDLLAAGREEEAIGRIPVVVLPGINHAQMCNGFVQGKILEEDFEPEIPQAEATVYLARVISAFFQMLRVEGAGGNSYNYLKSLVLETQVYVQAFLQAQDDDKGAWCTRTQTIVANLADPSLLSLTNVPEPDYESFKKSKASLEVREGIAYITTHSFENYTPLPEAPKGEAAGTFSEGRAAAELGCKTKNQDAVVRELGQVERGDEGSCREVHKAMLEEILKGVANRTRERYEEKGKQVELLPDRDSQTGGEWVETRVEFDRGEEGGEGSPASLRASRLRTSALIPNEFGGVTYCKKLSAAALASWVLHDSLPRGLSSSSSSS